MVPINLPIRYAISKAKENRKNTDETALEEGKIKDWAKSLAMAGVLVSQFVDLVMGWPVSALRVPCVH